MNIIFSGRAGFCSASSIAFPTEKFLRKTLFLAVMVLGTNLIPAAVNTASAQEAPRFSVSPRLYMTWISGGDEEPMQMPLYGISASATLAPQWDLTFTTLYGTGSNTSVDGLDKNENERLDFELLGRYRIPESPIYLVGGYRNINVEGEHFTSGVLQGTSEINIHLGELGMGFATRVSKSGRHAMFGNMVAGYGTQQSEQTGFGGGTQTSSDPTLMLDSNLGYQYAIERWLSLSARYRMIVVSTEDNGVTRQNFVFGPEIAATFRF